MKWRTLKCGYFLIIVLLSVIPAFRIVQFLHGNGANNVSADTLLFLPFLEKTLSGNYTWKDLFLYPIISGHLSTVPVAMLWVFAKTQGLNEFSILYFGIFLGALRVVLIFDAVAHRSRSILKWIFLPVFSALVFAPSLISVYEFELSSLQLLFSQLGLFLGVWALVRFPKTWFGVFVAAMAGWIATASHGSGVIVWPIFFFGMIFFGFKKFVQYLFLVIVGALACFPYFYVVFFANEIAADPTTISALADPFYHGIGVNYIFGQNSPLVAWFNFPLFIQGFGWPLNPDYSTSSSFLRGIIYLVVLSFGVLSLLFRPRRDFRPAILGFLFIAYGILSIWLVTCYRMTLTPWYATAFMPLYIGIAALAFFALFGKDDVREKKSSQINDRAVMAWGLFASGMLGYFFFTSNLAIKNKSTHMQFRRPVSASCIRHYDSAPTYCESSFFWTTGYPDYFSKFISILERYRLSVFSKRQRWTLQGDFILNSVQLTEITNVPDIFWAEGLEAKSVPFSEYEHLSLFLHTPNAVEWEVSLPNDLKKADFYSATAISTSTPSDLNADGVIFEVFVAEEGFPYHLYFSRYHSPSQREWKPFSVSLLRFAGKRIKIKLTSSMVGNYSNDWAMYRFPYIDLELGEVPLSSVPMSLTPKPLNTDLSPIFVKPSQKDFVFDLNDRSQWQIKDLKFLNGENPENENLILSGAAELTYARPVDVLISNYSHLYFQLKVPYEQYPITPKVTLLFDGPPGYRMSFSVPPLSDSKNHGYTYDLKLLELGQSTHLKGLEVEFKRMLDEPSHHEISFSNLRLISKGK